MHTFLLVMIKPLVLAVAGLLIWAISAFLDSIIPDGPIKRFLYKQRGTTVSSQASEPVTMPQRELEAMLLESRASQRQLPRA